MYTSEIEIAGYRIKKICRDAGAPVLYLHGENALDLPGWTQIVIDVDWNRDLTPWPESAVFRGQPDFGGGAGEYLAVLTEKILPEVEKDLRPQKRIVAGYSLAGMFAVYAACACDCFDGFASVSGSLWYPGFMEFVEKSSCNARHGYFSVGDREKVGRNPAFHRIEDCTMGICENLRQRGIETVFELNPGGHFSDPDGRMLKAARWLEGVLFR